MFELPKERPCNHATVKWLFTLHFSHCKHLVRHLSWTVVDAPCYIVRGQKEGFKPLALTPHSHTKHTYSSRTRARTHILIMKAVVTVISHLIFSNHFKTRETRKSNHTHHTLVVPPTSSSTTTTATSSSSSTTTTTSLHCCTPEGQPQFPLWRRRASSLSEVHTRKGLTGGRDRADTHSLLDNKSHNK